MSIESNDQTMNANQLFHRQTKPGEVPGTVVGRAGDTAATIHVVAYNEDELFEDQTSSLDAIDEWCEKFAVTWINIDGLGDADIIQQFGERFNLHMLALEDVVHVHQRAKVEEFEDHLFIVARMLNESTIDALEDSVEESDILTEQIAMFVGPKVVLTFQDGKPGDCLDPLRERIRYNRGRLRAAGPDALAYSILDTVIDHYFPVVQELANELDELDEQLADGKGSDGVARLHDIRGKLLKLRRILRPHAEAVYQLMRTDTTLISEETRLFLRDCHDHAIQLLDAVESCRESCSDIRDAYFTALSMRQNEVMQTLTIIATIFIPMSFIAGLYGMNFDDMPELHWSHGYAYALGLMLANAFGFLVFFWRRGWFGKLN